MKKQILVILALFICSSSFAQNKSKQANDFEAAKQIITQYCELLTQYGKKEDVAIRQQLLNLFERGNLVYNDFEDTYKEVEMFAYLNQISLKYDNNLQISFDESIDKLILVPYFSDNNIFVKTVITKNIIGNGINKKVKNELIIDIQNKKILNVFKAYLSDNIREISTNNYQELYNMAIAAYDNSEITRWNIDLNKREMALSYLEKWQMMVIYIHNFR